MIRQRSVWMTGGAGLVAFALISVLSLVSGPSTTAQDLGKNSPVMSYVGVVLPLTRKYCFQCHSSKAKRGGLDLERFTTAEDVRRDIPPWQGVIEHLEVGDMPPKGMPQPSAAEKKRFLAGVHGLLDADAREQAGDPGYVPLRRLSNAEYNATICDLTGVDLQPTREFPADGAAGEGFTNAAEALTEISPTLLDKYFSAAKETADHAVLLPDGFRFSPAKDRRDWTDESTAKLRTFYAAYTDAEGNLPCGPYLAATIRHRAALNAGKTTVGEVAAKEKLNAKYLGILWRTLTDRTPSYPLDTVRSHWRAAQEKDLPALAAEVAAWQNALWQVVRVGSYMHPVGNGYAESLTRQVPSDPPIISSQPLRMAVKPAPGQSEVELYLSARDLASTDPATVVWRNPRFEAVGKPPLLLRDYAQFGHDYEFAYSKLSGISHYLSAAIEAANDPGATVTALAQRSSLDPTLLQRWIEVLDVKPFQKRAAEQASGRPVPAVGLELLEEKMPQDKNLPAIHGWRKKGADLPVVVTNSSNTVEHIPGTASPHGVMVHPTPTEFVGVVWTSSVAGTVRIRARIKHAHPACGNGVAWWLEQRHGEKALQFAEGALELGGEAKVGETVRRVEIGDRILLAVDAKNGDHSCDLTDVSLNIHRVEQPDLTWDLAGDVADTVMEGNPHADRYGNVGAWSFVKGLARPVNAAPAPILPSGSVLARWREAASDPAHQEEARKLADEAQRLLTGPRPARENDPDRLLYDNLISLDSPLLRGISLARVAPAGPGASPFGLPKARFGQRQGSALRDDSSLFAASSAVLKVRLPAALFRDREFVVEGALDHDTGTHAVTFKASTAPPDPAAHWDGKSAVVADRDGAAGRFLMGGFNDFRRVFPRFLCFPNVIPNDEVVNLKMFHQEDEPLKRLFLDDAETRRLGRLWDEHRFISRQAVAENTYLPLFIGFVTQDQPKEMVAYFEGQRPAFRARAEAFQKEEQAAAPKQWAALLDFASRAYRRPLNDRDKKELLGLYQDLQSKGVLHDEALRGVLARILVAPSFLFRIEQAPPGRQPGPVNDWELATRLSYFLWASTPDAELRRLAAAGKLHNPQVLAAQTRRMLKDDRVRALGVEFGAQWLHVRGFDTLNEKNEKLFPTFDANLRSAMYEETVRFFQDLFQSDGKVTDILNADYTFLNETLAKHYGIPGVTGPEWRRVEGVRKYGRGGVLGLASVQTSESGASRTSPTLRGNWVVETLLGEKLPRPPANVPKIPEEEGSSGLTVRQQVEKHAKVPECAVCHVRIDPFGFALEAYDPIGRLRRKDLGGLPVDCKAKLKDGTEFDGIDGLRTYLLTKKRDVVLRLFCRRLLGYALGRSVALSDQPLLDTMMLDLNKNKGRLSVAVSAIVLSRQFRMIRAEMLEQTIHAEEADEKQVLKMDRMNGSASIGE